MINNRLITKQNQSFGRVIETQQFQKDFEEIYGKKDIIETAEMICAIGKIKDEHQHNPAFDFHLTGVDSFGRVKTKVRHQQQVPWHIKAAKKMTIWQKIADFQYWGLSNIELLFKKSEIALQHSPKHAHPPSYFRK